LVLDQCSIGIHINVAPGQSHPAIAALLMDEGTGIILGANLHSVDDARSSRFVAFPSTKSIILPMLRRYNLEISPHIESLTWTVPPSLQALRKYGPRRHGLAIMRLIGDRLALLKLKPRLTFLEAADLPTIADDGVSEEQGCKTLDLSIMAWNRDRLKILGITDSAPTEGRDRDLRRIARQFEQVMDPVLKRATTKPGISMRRQVPHGLAS
jgi:hypothetical protein